ncbi:hypothetical protein [Blattabacterium cuenoti]
MSVYNEKKIFKKDPIKKEQLYNIKDHLYKQILISMKHTTKSCRKP